MSLRWPSLDTPEDNNSNYPGISWLELVISFALWSGRYPPTKSKQVLQWHAYDFWDPKAQLLPLKERPWGALAESVRYIVNHIHTFSKHKFIPQYH